MSIKNMPRWPWLVYQDHGKGWLQSQEVWSLKMVWTCVEYVQCSERQLFEIRSIKNGDFQILHFFYFGLIIPKKIWATPPSKNIQQDKYSIGKHAQPQSLLVHCIYYSFIFLVGSFSSPAGQIVVTLLDENCFCNTWIQGNLFFDEISRAKWLLHFFCLKEHFFQTLFKGN